ncbi:MAG: hypothetical protein CSA15_01285 [Candidatus Delongbacteria bacterium]|nr:MAG: hypothetical protein CSA15_01285 [Candidatus Delongbacteria bacterium]
MLLWFIHTVKRFSVNKIVVVEDDRSFSDLLSGYIESLNNEYQVIKVEDVQSFIVEYNRGKIDYLFLDILLPGISGVELLKFLKSLNSDIKIFLMTGITRVYDESFGLADGYLEKPFELNKVKELLGENG